MKRFFVLLTALLLAQGYAQAQNAEDSIKKVINTLFEGMKESDPVKIRSVFTDSAILQTTINGKNGIEVKNEGLANFLEFIDKVPAGEADERIRFELIKIDRHLAVVWTPYEFYYKGQYSHCGINSFQMVREKGSWKIHFLIDSRTRSCK